MSKANLYFVDVQVEPTANPTSVLSDVTAALHKGCSGRQAELRYVFKVESTDTFVLYVVLLSMTAGKFLDTSIFPIKRQKIVSRNNRCCFLWRSDRVRGS